MSRRYRTVLFCLVLIGMAAAASALLITLASPERVASTQELPRPSLISRGPRNLFLQPEALRVARQLGKRFTASSRAVSIMAGTVTVAASEQPLTIARTQTDAGEQVLVGLGSRALSWNPQEGTKADSGVLSDTERLLVERLTLDSPDQFVLAQLRGVSYLTIARNVRPTDATDGYAGPLWDMVRIAEPQQSESLRPKSAWRIYYLNVQTGLPDRVEYELNDQPITVEFTRWTAQGTEKTPSHVRWSSNGQTLMELRLTSVSLNQQ